MFCLFRWIHLGGVNPVRFAFKGNTASIAEKVSNECITFSAIEAVFPLNANRTGFTPPR
jgi:hypothetical protein